MTERDESMIKHIAKKVMGWHQYNGNGHWVNKGNGFVAESTGELRFNPIFNANHFVEVLGVFIQAQSGSSVFLGSGGGMYIATSRIGYGHLYRAENEAIPAAICEAIARITGWEDEES